MSMEKKTAQRAALVLALALALVLLMAPTMASAVTVAVTNAETSVYATGALGSPIFATLAAGTRVQVISYGQNWTEISLSGETGYVITSSLVFYIPQNPTPTPAPTAAAHEKVETANSNATIVSANHGPVHVRMHPSLDAGLVNTFANGSRVRVLSQSGDWYYVQAGENVGYIDGEFISLDSGVSMNATDILGGYDAMVVNPTDGEILHLRQAPSTDSTSLGEYHNGTYVHVLAIGLEWMHVMVDGQEGYMMSEYLHVTNPSATSERLISANGGTATLYAEANTGSTALLQMTDGSVVNVLIPETDWSKVTYVEDGNVHTGYVDNSMLKDETADGSLG